MKKLFHQHFSKLIKFGVTGTLGLVIDFSLTWFIKEELFFNKFVANGIGFTVAVISNYFINKRWTFNNDKNKIAPQMMAFITVSSVGLLLNSTLLYVFNEMLSINFYLSKAMAIVLVFFWNFTASSLFVFNKRN